MAFYIITDKYEEKTWNLPTEKPLFSGHVKLFQADGDELEHIRITLQGIPIVRGNNRTCKWRGEMANFVFDNIQP